MSAPKQLTIAKRYGMSFISVIRMLDEQGHNLQTAADEIGMKPGSLAKAIEAAGIQGVLQRNRHLATATIRTIMRAQDEHGAPIEEVIRWYAEAGHSMAFTARALGFRVTTFRDLVERMGLRPTFRPREKTLESMEGSRRVTRAVLESIQRAQQAAEKTIPRVEYQGIVDTYRGHAERLGVGLTKVRTRRRRRPGDLEYIFRRRHHQGNQYRPIPVGHPWRME